MTKLYRPDLFRLLESQSTWDSVLSQEGFGLRMEYKKRLAELGCISEKTFAEFDALTIEGRKELASERIFWNHLPDYFLVDRLDLPYRSPLLNGRREAAKAICEANPNFSEADKGNALLERIFPWRGMLSDLWHKSPGLENEIRRQMIEISDDEHAVAAAREFGIDPVDRMVSAKEVKKEIVELCERKGLAKPAPRPYRKTGLLVGRSLGNGLVLILNLWEVRRSLSHGGPWYNMDVGIDIVTDEFFVSDMQAPAGVVWKGIDIGSEFFPYGLKGSSSTSFYIGLAHWLRCFELFAYACDHFFACADTRGQD